MVLLKINFEKLFQIEVPVWELMLRGALLYLGILILFRVLPRRTGGEMAMMDLVFDSRPERAMIKASAGPTPPPSGSFCCAP